MRDIPNCVAVDVLLGLIPNAVDGDSNASKAIAD